MKLLTYPVEAPTFNGAAMTVMAMMTEPIACYEDGLHLDGPLAYGAYLEWCDDHDRYSMPPMSEPWALDFDLPLDRWAAKFSPGEEVADGLLTEDGLVWGWCCSASFADWSNHGVHHVRKRAELELMARYASANVHNYGIGPLKAKNIQYPTVFAREVTWHARGDMTRVKALLDRVTHIGKLCGHGMGAVEEWTVEPAIEDLSVGNGCVTYRRMPASCAPAAMCRPMSIRAPYHHRSRMVSSVEAGTALGGV